MPEENTKRFYVRVTKTYWYELDRRTDTGIKYPFKSSRLLPTGRTPADTDLELTPDADTEVVDFLRTQGFEIEAATRYSHK